MSQDEVVHGSNDSVRRPPPRPRVGALLLVDEGVLREGFAFEVASKTRGVWEVPGEEPTKEEASTALFSCRSWSVPVQGRCGPVPSGGARSTVGRWSGGRPVWSRHRGTSCRPSSSGWSWG